MNIYIEKVKDYSGELTEAVNKLLVQLNETAVTLSDQEIKNMIAASANKFFVAKEVKSKKIVGMITLIVFRIPYAKKGWLEDLVVDNEYRGKGIGTKLMSAAIIEARKENVTCLDLTSNPKRVMANKFYQHLGFKKRDTNVYRIEL